MFTKERLSQSERDELLDSLHEKQRIFIKDFLKRGRRTVFANVLAKEKAGTEAGGHIAEKWELEDYLDAGPKWQSDSVLHCECGRKLRYQYIVKNLETNAIKKFGINHFEEHTGIPPQLAKEIVNGIERIDYEMDEVLMKISSGWSLADEGITEIPSSFEIPNHIQQHLDDDIPLLDRQVRRLKERIATALREMERDRLESLKLEKEKLAEKKQADMVRRRQQMIEKDRFAGKIVDDIPLDQNLQAGVHVFLDALQNETFRATELCSDLVAYHGASRETYSSGKLRIYSNVCIFLEYLAQQGIVELVEKQGVEDRIYRDRGTG